MYSALRPCLKMKVAGSIFPPLMCNGAQEMQPTRPLSEMRQAGNGPVFPFHCYRKFGRCREVSGIHIPGADLNIIVHCRTISGIIETNSYFYFCAGGDDSLFNSLHEIIFPLRMNCREAEV